MTEAIRQSQRYERSAMHSGTASVDETKPQRQYQQRQEATPSSEIHYDHSSGCSVPDETKFGKSPLVHEQNLIEASFDDKRWMSSNREGAGRPKSRRGRRVPSPCSSSPDFDQLVLHGSERPESGLSRSRRTSEEIVELPWQTRRASEVTCERPRTRHGVRRRSTASQDVVDLVRMSPAVPSPPPTPQMAGRDASARQRRRRSTLTYEPPNHASNIPERPSYTRSLSSSKFSVLPAIGIRRPPAVDSSLPTESVVTIDPVASDGLDMAVPTEDIVLPDEPSSDEPRLLLGVKLPSGKRVQRYFRLNDTLDSLLRFAESAAGCALAGSELVCGTIPKRHFHDLQLTIESCQLKDKTVLHIQAPEMP